MLTPPYIDEISDKQIIKTQKFAVFSTSNNSFIGFADIDMHYHNSITINGENGYFFLTSFWGNGYATEIANLWK